MWSSQGVGFSALGTRFALGRLLCMVPEPKLMVLGL